jgi:hypothetical protein
MALPGTDAPAGIALRVTAAHRRVLYRKTVNLAEEIHNTLSVILPGAEFKLYCNFGYQNAVHFMKMLLRQKRWERRMRVEGDNFEGDSGQWAQSRRQHQSRELWITIVISRLDYDCFLLNPCLFGINQ